jgi:hypothetical protein
MYALVNKVDINTRPILPAEHKNHGHSICRTSNILKNNVTKVSRKSNLSVTNWILTGIINKPVWQLLLTKD